MQMSGHDSQRRGTARTLPKNFVLFYVLYVLCRSVYCLCVNMYCTTATGCQPNCILTNISYHIIHWGPKYKLIGVLTCGGYMYVQKGEGVFVGL